MKTATGFLVCVLCATTANAVDLVADPSFHQGFYVKNRAGKEQALQWNNARGRDKNQTPVWHTAQHDSKSCFADAAFCKFRKDGLTFRDEFQTLIVHSEDADADIILGVNAMKEYGGVWRKPGDPWPHLYVQQDICQPGSRLWATAPTIADLERLNMDISVRLLYDHQNRGSQFNPDVHAAQFQFFLSVQNLNTKSKGFSDYYWFGVSLYDNRREVTSLLAMQDVSQARKKGTEKFIYDVGLAPFTSQVVAKGHWVAVHGDLLPHIRAGLDECWKRGFLPDSKDLADYRIGGIFLGWEIPGLNDAAVAVKNLSLIAVPKTR
jgi:hypothetical protein